MRAEKTSKARHLGLWIALEVGVRARELGIRARVTFRVNLLGLHFRSGLGLKVQVQVKVFSLI